MDPDWLDTTLPVSVDDWDGIDIEATVEAEAICGDAGEVCPDGDYYVEVYIEYVSDDDGNTYYEYETSESCKGSIWWLLPHLQNVSSI